MAMKMLPDRQGELFEEPECFGPRTFLKHALARFPDLAADEPYIEIGIHISMSALARLILRELA